MTGPQLECAGASQPCRTGRRELSRGGHPNQSLSPAPPPAVPFFWGGEAVGKRQRRIRALSTTGQVAGAATESSGSKPTSSKTGLPNQRSPRSPCPSQPTVRRDPDTSLRATVSCPESRRKRPGCCRRCLRRLRPREDAVLRRALGRMNVVRCGHASSCSYPGRCFSSASRDAGGLWPREPCRRVKL